MRVFSPNDFRFLNVIYATIFGVKLVIRDFDYINMAKNTRPKSTILEDFNKFRVFGSPKIRKPDVKSITDGPETLKL